MKFIQTQRRTLQCACTCGDENKPSLKLKPMEVDSHKTWLSQKKPTSQKSQRKPTSHKGRL